MHACSDDELGLTPGLDYPLIEESTNEVVTWKKKFKCVEEDKYVVWGNFNTA